MNRRALLQLALATGCARAPERRDDRSLAWVHVGREFGEIDAEEEAWSKRELARLAALLRDDLSRRPKADPARVLRDIVFGASRFEREVEDPSLEFVLLPLVLRRKRGNCVGLGTLLLALAESVGADAHGVLRPGHFHVRVRALERVRNVEPLRAGEELPESWYEQRFPILGASSAYARALTPAEVLGVIEYNIGNARKKAERWSEARRAFLRAAAHFPDFAEAHASLGSVFHVEGDLEAAERAYRRALDANPALPGVEWNLEILRAERGGERRSRQVTN